MLISVEMRTFYILRPFHFASSLLLNSLLYILFVNSVELKKTKIFSQADPSTR